MEPLPDLQPTCVTLGQHLKVQLVLHVTAPNFKLHVYELHGLGVGLMAPIFAQAGLNEAVAATLHLQPALSEATFRIHIMSTYILRFLSKLLTDI